MNNKKIYTNSILFMMFVAAVCNTTQGIMLTDFIDYYRLESSRQGLMSSFQSLGNILALLLLGIIIGRMKKSKLLMAVTLTIPLMFILMGSKPAFYILLCGYTIYGIAFGFLDSVASSVMVDIYQQDSSRYMNRLHGIYGLGGLAGPLIIQGLNKSGFLWYQVLILCGVMAAGAAVVYAMGAASVMQSKTKDIETSSKIHIRDAKNFLLEKRKRILLICAFLYGAHQIGITVWVTRYISEYLAAPEWGPGAISAFWIGMAVSRLVITKTSMKRTTVLFMGHLFSGLVILMGVLAGNGLFMLICCGIAGLAEGPVLPMTLDLACGWELERTSLGSSMVLFAHYTGYILIPPLIGVLIEICGVRFGMMIPSFLSLIAAFFAFYLIFNIKE